MSASNRTNLASQCRLAGISPYRQSSCWKRSHLPVPQRTQITGVHNPSFTSHEPKILPPVLLVDPKKHLNSTTTQADDHTNASRFNFRNTARRKREKSNALEKGCRQHASYGVRPRNVSGSDCQLASLQYMPLVLSSLRTFGLSFCHTPYFVAITLVWRYLLTIRVG